MTAAEQTAHATSAMLEVGAVMLGAALIFVILFRKFGLGATLGYIVAGALIGPQMLKLVDDPERMASLSEIGIALLLFVVGLELQPSRLWRLRKDIFGLGLAQVVLCGLALSLFIHFALDVSAAASLAIGLPLALSSTAQVLPMLRSDGDLNTPQGERTFSILLFQDLSIVPLITIVAALSRAPPDPEAPSGAMLALITVGAVVALVLAGRWVLNPMFRLIGRLGERELFVVAGLFTVVGASAFMHSLGLSVALGAFIAGVMLAESPYRHELESDVEPFRSIFLGLFFVAVGMMLDLGTIMRQPLTVVGLALAVIAIKAGIIAGLARAFGNSWPRSVRLGLLISQAGEFGFVLFAQATAAQLILPQAASLFGAVVTLSMAATPFLMKLTDWLERREERGGEGFDGPDQSPETSAIVVGYGRFGQTVAQMLMAKSIGVTLIDKEVELIETAGDFGTKVYFGDGLRIDLLRTAGAETARLIVFCNDNHDGELTPEAMGRVLDAFPQASVLVRAYDRRHLLSLRSLDLAFAQREMFESAVKMGKAALGAVGFDGQEIERVESEYRLRDCERMERQGETGDLKAGIDRSFSATNALPDEA
ncbi:monovalent cation:proton antiporter-2 (CPA2) family protein [Sphingomonas sp. LY29]|uniref:monovalent cation:proton antiporter-2 (CPA2) family protein n=1 Tax=Sphingomonas sp. LY29 TaxID=3095341 RepID=UPI002D79C984|nr:monovalent cation:proton antiporter-2 (CPA2) family protein [Sphingomonas sp. LY29]WRP26719.1 monovalent cation:proton antiporter-2 (CPA2) family protein [Sphingomonas sp. LY29]